MNRFVQGWRRKGAKPPRGRMGMDAQGRRRKGAALRAILKLEGITPTNEELIDIGIKVGSDVPWAIFDKPTLLRRKGDILEFFELWGNSSYNKTPLLSLHCLIIRV